MPHFLKTQNSFALGEISSDFFARGDLKASELGLAKLENMDVMPSGGIRRRNGTKRLATLSGATVLIPFSVSPNDNFLIALGNLNIKILLETGQFWQSLISPWNINEISEVQYAQRFGTMIFVHPNHKPQVLKKLSDGSFQFSDFDFSVNDDMSRNAPFMKFDDAYGIKLSFASNSNGNNYATITASAIFWTSSNVGGRIYAIGKQWVISQFISSTQIVAYTNGSYTLPGYPISDWREAAFSNRRGWPASITFHQDRLVFGGGNGWPCGVWMSKVGDHYNFNAGTGLDDEMIFLTLLSDKQQQIYTVISADNLQILTSAGEWAISNKPLTPSSIDIKQHTDVGSKIGKYLKPQKIEGSTCFITRGMNEIRELILDNLSETYSATNLCALSGHLMNTPVSMAYNETTRQLFIVMQDGGMAYFIKNSAVGISAWGTYKTDGAFKSVAVLNDSVYIIADRADGTFLEKFDESTLLDSDKYGFSYTAESMPLLAAQHSPNKLRIYKVSARVQKSKYLKFVIGGHDYNALSSETEFSGDVSVNLIGTENYTMGPIWKISGSLQIPCEILSVTVDGKYEI